VHGTAVANSVALIYPACVWRLDGAWP
jgi:hypothetical protein